VNATALRLQIADSGWNPIPVNGKAAVAPQWSKYCREAPSNDEITMWGRLFAKAVNTGLALGRQIAIDIDASDRDLAHRIRVLAVEHLGETPFVRVGREPRLALLYRAAEPIASRHFKSADGTCDGIEILSDGTQIVAYGDHPVTSKPYQWIGPAEPLTASPNEAPAITAAQVETFLDRVHALMPLGATGQVNGKRPTGTGTSQQIIRNDAGLVVDGRERFLAACIWKAAGHLHGAGEALTVEAVAALGWSFFTDANTGADLRRSRRRDRQWTERDAIGKARGTIRRLETGAAAFRKTALTVEPTYADTARPVEEARQAVEAALERFLRAHT
jgi:hypothetical protein